MMDYQPYIDFIMRHKPEAVILILVVLFFFRKKIARLFKKEKKDYPPPMPNGESFEGTFDFNKTLAEEKDTYEKRLQEIDKELESINAERNKMEEGYTKRKTMLLHRERQLKLQYNTFLGNMKNLEKMTQEQEEMEQELNTVSEKEKWLK